MHPVIHERHEGSQRNADGSRKNAGIRNTYIEERGQKMEDSKMAATDPEEPVELTRRCGEPPATVYAALRCLVEWDWEEYNEAARAVILLRKAAEKCERKHKRLKRKLLKKKRPQVRKITIPADAIITKKLAKQDQEGKRDGRNDRRSNENGF